MTLKDFFYIDNLSLLMMGLIGFVALCIASFSSRYLQGDSQQKQFFLNLTGLVGTVSLLVCTDHMALFVSTWFLSNFFLTRLMLHKKEWAAARASAQLAFYNFALGTFFIAAGFIILFYATGLTSLQAILQANIHHTSLFIGSLFIFLGGMTQSALWPFHQWLTSSLNSPTPVSALMHAGLINGGGFLLARCAPLFLQQPLLLHIIFVAGLFTAFLGTLWKLMQYDIKRMLACSTMGQMGFMMAQCGLGLFGAAVAHLFWHGLFKAYLFLGSDSVAQQKKLSQQRYSIGYFCIALVYGCFTTSVFCLITGKTVHPINTNLFLIVLVGALGTQFVLPLLASKQPFKYFVSSCAALLIGTLYGVCVQSVYTVVEPLHITQPQPLTPIYALGLVLLLVAWLCMLFGTRVNQTFFNKWYVAMLNASQPKENTVTTHRNHYHYKGVSHE